MQAMKSFSRAVHINPADTELREDDLMWAAELVHRKASFDRAAAAAAINSSNTELDIDGDSAEDSSNQLTAQHMDSGNLPSEPSAVELEKFPSNYVIMRD